MGTRFFSDRTLSSRELLAQRVRAVSEAWAAGDEAALREEMRELSREAGLLAASAPLLGVARRQQIASEAAN